MAIQTPKLKLLQWNVRSVSKNRTDLSFLANKHDIDIAILSETWLLPNQNFTFSGYRVYRSDRHDGYGGSAILIKKSIAAAEIPIDTKNSKFQATCIKLKNLSLISIYNSPSNILSDQQLNNLISNIDSPFLLLGDFNFHHFI